MSVFFSLSGCASDRHSHSNPFNNEDAVYTTLTLPNPSKANKFITIGSSKKEVAEVQGTPESISDLGWHYGNGSWVYFNEGKVSGWINRENNLKVWLKGAKLDEESPLQYHSSAKGISENHSYYGQISAKTGRPKTTYGRGYYRKNGTYVRGHYRS